MSVNDQDRRISGLRSEMRRVLIVQRDPDALQALQGSLAEAGFAVTVLGGDEDALDAMDRSRPHLVMLDWEHSSIAAHSLIRRIQRDEPSKRARLMALSPNSNEDQIVAGFELGVDDYVVRPYSLPVLMARVRALLRAGYLPPEAPDILEFHRLRMDLIQRQLTIGTISVVLRPMEYRLIEFLMHHPERVFTREQMLSSGIWPSDSRADRRAVDVTVQRARKALSRHACGDYLQTVRAVGYRLSARS
jgi:two-component system, OmpR family, phosphate regulon response regulator PhoB